MKSHLSSEQEGRQATTVGYIPAYAAKLSPRPKTLKALYGDIRRATSIDLHGVMNQYQSGGPLLRKAMTLILSKQHVCAELLQLEFGIDKWNADLLVDEMRLYGLVKPLYGPGPLKVCLSLAEFLRRRRRVN